jgi:hypothetical protein
MTKKQIMWEWKRISCIRNREWKKRRHGKYTMKDRAQNKRDKWSHIKEMKRQGK